MRTPKSHFLDKRVLLNYSLWEHPVEGKIREVKKEPGDMFLYVFEVDNGDQFFIPIGDAVIRILEPKLALAPCPVINIISRQDVRTRGKLRTRPKSKTKPKTKSRSKSTKSSRKR